MLEAFGLHKRWSDGSTVLAGVDLVIGEGELALVEGPNGAGKSTLIRIVAGLLDPDAGTVRVARIDPCQDRSGYQREIGLVSAGSSGLYARLDVVGHLRLTTGLGLMPRRRARQLVAEAIERFGLERYGRRRVDRLSMGERQRLRLAMGFVGEPGLVLLDEPLTSLDPDGRQVLAIALDDHLAAGRSALWVAPTGEDPARAPHLRAALTAGRLCAS